MLGGDEALAAEVQAITPPHSLEAEKALLGAVLREPEKFNSALEMVRAEYFFLDSHRKIFQAMLELDQSNEPADFITVAEKLRADSKQSTLLRPAYLVELTENAPLTENIEFYAQIIREQYFLRRIVNICNDTVKNASSQNVKALEVINNLEKVLVDIAGKHDRGGLQGAAEILDSTLLEIEERLRMEGQVTGCPSGFIDLDDLTSGWQKSDLIICAARPGMGKTAFAINASVNAAKAGKSVAYFSLEMAQNQLMARILAAEARVDSSRLRRGDLSEDEQDRLLHGAKVVAKLPGRLSIDETAAITLAELRSRCRRCKKEHGLDLVVIDYLQLMGSAQHRDNREREIAEISAGLKALAKELNIAVMALAQLNRGPDARPDKRPKISDLRESGSIEQDADLILFLYRDDYYNKNSEDAGKVEVIVSKNRHGQQETIKLAWLGNFQLFHNLQELR